MSWADIVQLSMDQYLALTGIKFKAAGMSTHLCSSCFFCPEELNDTENVVATLWASNKTCIVHAFSGALGKRCAMENIDTVAVRSTWNINTHFA